MGLNPRHLAQFCYSLSTCLKSGLPLSRSLEVTGRHNPSKRLKFLSADLLRKVKEGSKFAEALESQGRLWPRHFVEHIRAGEMSGKLYLALEEESGYWEDVGPLAYRARSAWLVPLVIFLSGWAVSTGMMAWARGFSFVIPQMRTLATPVVLAVAVVFLSRYSLEARRIFHPMVLHLPLLRELSIDLSLFYFFRAFNVMYGSGLSVEAMVEQSIRTVENAAVADELRKSLPLLKQGRRIAESLAVTPLIPPYYIEEIKVGEDSGEVEEALARVAQFSQAKASTKIESLYFLLQPITFLITIFSVVGTYFVYIKGLRWVPGFPIYIFALGLLVFAISRYLQGRGMTKKEIKRRRSRRM
jgi:type II secretory pathway component PulF